MSQCKNLRRSDRRGTENDQSSLGASSSQLQAAHADVDHMIPPLRYRSGVRRDKGIIAFGHNRHVALFFFCLLCLGSAMAWSQHTIYSITRSKAASANVHYLHQSPAYINTRPRRLSPKLFTSNQSSTPINIGSARLDHPLINDLSSQLEILMQVIESNSGSPFEQEDDLSSQSFELLRVMLSSYFKWLTQTTKPTQQQSDEKKGVKPLANAVIDKAFRSVTTYAFSTPYTLERINLGMHALKLQLHPETFDADQSVNGSPNDRKKHQLMKPYNSIPRGTWLKALCALTSTEINSRSSGKSILSISTADEHQFITPAHASFRILQRLITKKGVRISNKGKQQQQQLDERDFNMVLHAHSTTNQMHAAHRVMALQERTPHAPPLSPVPYSILLKAYGQREDIKNVEMSIYHAKRNGVVPDIVMANTVLDAFVNCGLADRAEELFGALTTGNGGEDIFWPLLRPNVRTYNTMLKGMATEGRIDEAMRMSETMRKSGIWDDITTNTLVKVAVTAQEFEVAECLLSNYTSSVSSKYTNRHPNVEAYTELIDGYAKDNQLEKALETMQLMQNRGVSPNEYTYTCIVGALTRNNKVRQAKKMIEYVTGLQDFASSSRRGRRLLTPIFNAFLSGLLSVDGNEHSNAPGQSHSLNILEALNMLSEMEQMNIYPNVVTVTLLVDGLANCNPPRSKEAKDLVQHLEFTARAKQKRYSQALNGSTDVSLSNTRIATALIRAYGRANDLDSAMEAFRRISTPDVIALNALLDACCRCSELKLALDTFKKYASFEEWKNDAYVVGTGVGGEETRIRPIKPDVVTYTTLIAAVLQLKTKNASKRASMLYDEMKQVWRISPDTILVDR